MNLYLKRALYWAPRVLAVAFALFLSLFALDVFNEGLPFWRLLLALFMHLIPTFVLIAVILLAWRWEWIGAALFAATGVLYLVMFHRHPSWVLIISGPQFLIALLFLLGWWKRAEARP